MKTPYRYVQLSLKVKDKWVGEQLIELNWQVINDDVVDDRITKYGPGYYALVEEISTIYIFRVMLG